MESSNHHSRHQIGNYLILECLGSGSTSTVYKGKHLLTQNFVAIKTIEKKNLHNRNDFDLLRREVQILKSLDHPFIPVLYEVLDDESKFYIVQEFAEGGSLLDYVNNHQGLLEPEVRRIFIQIISALNYLHNQCNLLHRDLKAENILLDRCLNVRVIDFGFAKQFASDKPLLQTTCGSPGYIAPEVILSQPYGPSADIWSVGVVLYACASGQLPFNGTNLATLLENIVQTEPEIPEYFSNSLKRLLLKLLSKKPENRPKISEILCDPWVLEADSYIRNFDSILPSLSIFNEVDPQIISILSTFDLETNSISRDLTTGNINPTTAVYKILKKDKIVEELKGKSRQLKKNGVTQSIKALANLPPLVHFMPETADSSDALTGRPLSPEGTAKNSYLIPPMTVPGAPEMVLPSKFAGQKIVTRFRQRAISAAHRSAPAAMAIAKLAPLTKP